MKDPILIVDDEPGVLSALRRTLMDEPYQVLTAGSGEEGLKLLKKHRVKVVISDEMMPGMSGAEFLAQVRERYKTPVRILLTGRASLEATLRAVNRGEIYRFFTKPWDDVELKMAIRSAVEKYDLEAENRRLLQTVRRQAVELKLLEKEYPGISELKRDEDGTVPLPDLSDEEYARIVAECQKQDD